MTHVEYSDKFQQWVVLDAFGDIRAIEPTRNAARSRSVEIHKQDRWAMGIMGLLGLWTQEAVAKTFNVSARTVREAMQALRSGADR